jgi:hypothetical protein
MRAIRKMASQEAYQEGGSLLNQFDLLWILDNNFRSFFVEGKGNGRVAWLLSLCEIAFARAGGSR